MEQYTNTKYYSQNKKSIQFWDSQARRYNLATRMNLRVNEKFGQTFAIRFGTGRKLRVLDVGTGCGFAAIKVALLGHEVWGIDISEPMLDNARYNAREFDAEVAFENRDAAATGYQDGYFDVVMFVDALYTIESDGKALKEAERILAPGGSLLIMDGNYFVDQKIDSYRRRKEYFNVKYGFDEMLTKPEIRNIDYPKLRELVLDFHINKVRRPSWETWFTRGLGFTEVHIYPRDTEGFEEITQFGKMNSPLTYTLIARKPMGLPFEGKKIQIPDHDIKTKIETEGRIDAGVFGALSHVDRIRILGCLLYRGRSVSQICRDTGLAQNAVSYHLRLLKEGGLIEMSKQGRETICRCAEPDVALYLFNLACR